MRPEDPNGYIWENGNHLSRQASSLAEYLDLHVPIWPAFDHREFFQQLDQIQDLRRQGFVIISLSHNLSNG